MRNVTVTITRFTPDAWADARALVDDPSLLAELGWLRDQGELRELLDGAPHHDPAWLAHEDGRPVGWCALVVRPDPRGHWAMARLGVVESHRRRGIGTRLLQTAETELAGLAHDLRPYELGFSAWIPNPAAEAFAARHGFARARLFWQMERRDGARSAPEWPNGVAVRVFDGSDSMVRDWNAVSNDAFAGAFHTTPSTEADCLAITRRPEFHASGLALAYLGDRCVGFCRNGIYRGRGEVDILGVAHDARGTGLGRALLRWGVAWLIAEGAERVTLIVDGHNESALALYRSEGFEPVRTRTAWARPFMAP
ncbi:MAG TPA: GNAT family N-acetyltransferase [Candidatus Limnocylindria bacterium]|nr:GNAT family N-acetyltransferase [Candidatus Limnocylindria bacterium]